jgi:hypothetical protein
MPTDDEFKAATDRIAALEKQIAASGTEWRGWTQDEIVKSASKIASWIGPTIKMALLAWLVNHGVEVNSKLNQIGGSAAETRLDLINARKKMDALETKEWRSGCAYHFQCGYRNVLTCFFFSFVSGSEDDTKIFDQVQSRFAVKVAELPDELPTPVKNALSVLYDIPMSQSHTYTGVQKMQAVHAVAGGQGPQAYAGGFVQGFAGSGGIFRSLPRSSGGSVGWDVGGDVACVRRHVGMRAAR